MSQEPQQLLPINDIVVEEARIRRHFDEAAITELADSISARGLIHAPVVRFVDGAPVLVAGERRLRAMKKLASEGKGFRYNNQEIPPGIMPYTTLHELPESEVFAIELEENIIRRDISWQERVEAEKKLHDLRCAANPAHTVADTARIIYGGPPTPHETLQTRTNIILAEHLDDPDIRKAKNEREATQIARRKLETLFVNALAERTQVSASQHTLLHGDCVELLPTLPPQAFDCMVTDPPYGINAHTFTKQSGTIDSHQHDYSDTRENAQRIVSALATAACMKDSAHIWMFCDVRLFNDWAAVYEDAGWYVWPHPIIWSKGDIGTLLGNANGPRHVYEAILFAQRGNKKISKIFPDVLTFRGLVGKDHAAQKPVDLIAQLITLSCIAGEKVIDPCCGSGTIFPAATASKVIATGIELDDNFHNQAKLRLVEGGAD